MQKNKKNFPIGIFDSGVGGLTVLDAIRNLLPQESIIYFGDTAHVPYGNKSKERVQKLSVMITKFLVSKKIKLLVVACNTASSFALGILRKKFNIPVMGVIEPGVKEALKSGKIFGVIGTEGTIKSKSYENLLKKFDKNITVFSNACPLLVPLIEEAWFNLHPDIVSKIAEKYLEEFKTKKIDTLILGCTHYPLIKSLLKKLLKNKIKIIDSASATAAQVKNLLVKNCLNSSNKVAEYKFYVSDSVEKFVNLAKKFIDKKSVVLPTFKNTKRINMDKIYV